MAGGVLVLLGGLLTWWMMRGAPDSRAVPGSGIAIAVGLALVFWGLVAAAVGLVTRG